VYNSDVFDSGLFDLGSDTITLDTADARYLKLSGGTVRGLTTFAAGLSVNGTLLLNGDILDLSLISGVVAGTPQASKALSLNGSGVISGNLTLTGGVIASQLTGAIQTVAQPLITSLGTLSALTIGGNLVFTGGSRTLTGLSSLTATSLNGTLITAAQTNITSVGTLSSLTMNMGGIGIDTPGLKFNGTTFDQSLYLSITQGAGVASKAMVLNSSKDISGINSLSATTLNGTTSVSGTLGDFGSLSIGSTSVITFSRNIQNIGTLTTSDTIKCSRGSSAQTFNSTNGSSQCVLYHFVNSDCYWGTTTSNDLYLQTNNVPRMRINGSTGAITGISSLTATGTITANSLAGFLTFGNQTAITTVGPLTELGINIVNSTAYCEIKGSGFAYLDSSYTRMCRFQGSNATPCDFQIEVSNGTAATSTNATWIGNISSTDLRFGTSNNTSMILTDSGRLGIGTTTPAAPLSVPNSVNNTYGAGGSMVYRLRTDNGITEMALGPIVYSVSGIFGGYITCQAMAMTSDRRLKKNIITAPVDRIKRLYDNVEVKLYDWIESENRPGQEVGIIAQDLVKCHLTDLISVVERDDMKEGDDPLLEPAGQKLSVDYSRISVYNMKMIQDLLNRVDQLEKLIS